MSVHPRPLCPVPEGECVEHLPADDGLRRALEEALAEDGTNRSALLLGALLSACDYVVAADRSDVRVLGRELDRLTNRVTLVRSLLSPVRLVCSCPGPCRVCPPLTSDEEAGAEFVASRPMFEKAG